MHRGIHQCDLSCKYLHFPVPDGSPLHSSYFGVAGSGQIAGTTEEFLPKVFDYIGADVARVSVTLEKLQTIKLTIRDLLLTGPQSVAERAYALEDWKLFHLNELQEKKLDKPLAPIFVLFLPEGMQVLQNKCLLRINGTPARLIINQTAELIGLPDSYPPLTSEPKPAKEKYSYFCGKSTVFYAPLSIDCSYVLDIELEAINFIYELGLLFPFRETMVHQFLFDADEPLVIPKATAKIVDALRRDSFPNRQEHNWARGLNPEIPPDL